MTKTIEPYRETTARPSSAPATMPRRSRRSGDSPSSEEAIRSKASTRKAAEKDSLSVRPAYSSTGR